MSDKSAVEIWQQLQAKGARVRYRAVSAEDIEAAEKELSLRFPPAYVELVTTLGAPAVLPRLPPRADPTDPDNLDYTMLVPSEIVDRTFELRDSVEPELFEDPASVERVREQLDEAVFFQIGIDAGEGFVWLLETQDESSEMHVGDYSHEYLEELDWAPGSEAVFTSFRASQERVAELIVESWVEYADS